jgi:hypothetical protein
MSNSYWVKRNLDGEAIGILDENPKMGQIEVCRVDNPFDTGWVGYYMKVNGVIHYHDTLSEEEYDVYHITKAQYETYQALGLFDE